MSKEFDWEIYKRNDYAKGRLIETEFGLKPRADSGHSSYVSIFNMVELAGILIHRANVVNNPEYSNFRRHEITVLKGTVRVRKGLDDSELERLALELSRRKSPNLKIEA